MYSMQLPIYAMTSFKTGSRAKMIVLFGANHGKNKITMASGLHLSDLPTIPKKHNTKPYLKAHLTFSLNLIVDSVKKRQKCPQDPILGSTR